MPAFLKGKLETPKVQKQTSKACYFVPSLPTLQFYIWLCGTKNAGNLTRKFTKPIHTHIFVSDFFFIEALHEKSVSVWL